MFTVYRKPPEEDGKNLEHECTTLGNGGLLFDPTLKGQMKSQTVTLKGS